MRLISAAQFTRFVLAPLPAPSSQIKKEKVSLTATRRFVTPVRCTKSRRPKNTFAISRIQAHDTGDASAMRRRGLIPGNSIFCNELELIIRKAKSFITDEESMMYCSYKNREKAIALSRWV
jgi:hypothetical protein